MTEQRTCVKCRKSIAGNSYHSCGSCNMGPLHYPCMLKHWEETGGKNGECRVNEPTAHLDWLEAKAEQDAVLAAAVENVLTAFVEATDEFVEPDEPTVLPVSVREAVSAAITTELLQAYTRGLAAGKLEMPCAHPDDECWKKDSVWHSDPCLSCAARAATPQGDG